MRSSLYGQPRHFVATRLDNNRATERGSTSMDEPISP